MPTTLFAQLQHPPLDARDDCDVHYIHHSTALYVISEHEYVHSLIPTAAQREPRVKTPPDRAHSPPFRRLSNKKAPRPLMATMAFTTASNMGIEGPPGSPPDLTNSKSSKSSSFHSSTLSDIMGPSDLSHFEDINLDDLQGALAPASFPMPVSPSNHVLFEAPRTSISSVSSSRSTPHPHASTHSFRDLTGSAKPKYLGLKGQINGAVPQQSGLNAPRRSVRRGFTSPSAPSLQNITGISPSGRRSRSPSPSHPQVFSSAPRTLSRRSSRNLEVSPSSSLSARRQSLQHGARKTAKEREAECDDEDDELPDDAIIWNVPISPRPPQERSPAPSASPSACNSPPQTSPSPATSRPVSRRGQPAHEPSSSSKPSPATAPRKFCSRTPSPNPSQVNNSSESQPLTRQRTNTWECTYTTLDPEAKQLTEALEQLQVEYEKQQEVKLQQPGLARSTSVDQHKPKTKPSTNSLPPLRKNDPLIDPFQPSKEKEKYLSRTRPSWLPPKDPKEEKKHLKEVQKMLVRIQEAEAIEKARAEKQRQAREEQEVVKGKLWDLLLPKWESEVTTDEGKQKYRELWWHGIPPKLRGRVWQLAIGNDLSINETTFNVALEKAKAGIKEYSYPTEESFRFKGFGDMNRRGSLELSYLPLIEANTKFVFPDLKLFAPGQPLHQSLVDICLAYTAYRPDVDTLAGIHHIAALFLLNMSPVESFTCLCNLLNRSLPISFLLNDPTAMTNAYGATLAALSKKCPTLANKLQALRVEPREYLDPMFRSLFCDRLPLEHAARVMDVYVVEGDKIPPRVAVGILIILEGKLYSGGVEEVLRVIGKPGVNENVFGGNRFPVLGADDFMEVVFSAGKK
ncbi:hypothetical protein K469DRAFT_577824 [Zopfia rhizophila CBS 207.26]|uniref:Rab-GAP TBC domain-containing protein n=1 Tax=Zopfia rhizophila CBS 207.26 TaxID=1314779 RepID=A0A6A6DZN4_9PEZI|nr:hypothetical protein K469DRAFT_577824 [Zopfia rhizophila CBS 207.26]